jgi:hypothetical protein
VCFPLIDIFNYTKNGGLEEYGKMAVNGGQHKFQIMDKMKFWRTDLVSSR